MAAADRHKQLVSIVGQLGERKTVIGRDIS